MNNVNDGNFYHHAFFISAFITSDGIVTMNRKREDKKSIVKPTMDYFYES